MHLKETNKKYWKKFKKCIDFEKETWYYMKVPFRNTKTRKKLVKRTYKITKDASKLLVFILAKNLVKK